MLLSSDTSVDEEKPKVTFNSKMIILAAGTIGSTILTLKYTQSFNQPCRLYSNPCFASAFMIPKKLSHKAQPYSFAMGQLAFCLREPSFDAFGTLYALEGLLAHEIISHLPLTRKNAIKLTRYLAPAMVLANCFLPGTLSENTIEISHNHAFIKGKNCPIPNIATKLSRHLRNLGAYHLPFSTQFTTPGSDIHYAGTLPMSVQEKPLTVNANGELHGHKNFYIVDGAILPNLPAKNLTFTLMANADRIARSITNKVIIP